MMTPQDRQKLLDVLLAPDNPGPEPAVDKPSAMAMLFSGLGDAVNAFAANKYGGVTSSYFDQYLKKQNQQKADLQRYKEKVAEGGNEAKRRTANYLLSADDRARMRADELAGRKALQDDAQAARKAIADQTAAAAADAVNARREDIVSRERIAKMETDARLKAERMQVGLHEKKATDSADKEQHAEYAKARQFIIAKKREYSQALAEGKATPEQIRQEWADILDASDLTGDYRAAADAFWQDKIGVGLFQYEYQNQGPQNQGMPTPLPAPPSRRSTGLRDVGGGL
jgi:membrane protein involved in colicin uptake